jgi:type IV fimbrial biogenesis protein FimT
MGPVSRMPRDRTEGFTLVELLTVLTIVAILVKLATPSFDDFLTGQQVRSFTADLQSSVLFARSEAATRATDVSVVPNGGDWSNGWVIQLVDGTVLRKVGSSPRLAAMPSTSIVYRRDGHLAPPAPRDVVAHGATSTRVGARCVRFDLSGRPAVLIDSDGNVANGCN